MSASPLTQIRVSAPGKLMLLGEHAVVYQRPCLVTAMDARLHLTLQLTGPGDDSFTIFAPDVGVDGSRGRISAAFAGGQALAPGTRFIESALAVFHERYGLARGLVITTRSDFPSNYGLGSSSATVAAMLLGLARLFDLALEPDELFALGLDAVRRVQQLGSGFDLATAIYGGTLFYDNARPRQILPLDTVNIPLVVAYSGVKADTPTYVRRVAGRLERWPDSVNGVFDVMAHIVKDARCALEDGDWPRLGELMDMQHGLAHALGVDTDATARLVFAAREAGAYGAKLSGAGGGDCIIALVPDGQRAAIEAALVAAGGLIIRSAPHASGARLESENVAS